MVFELRLTKGLLKFLFCLILYEKYLIDDTRYVRTSSAGDLEERICHVDCTAEGKVRIMAHRI